MNNTQEHKDYIPAELEVVSVDSTDIICTSSSIYSLEDGGEI